MRVRALAEPADICLRPMARKILQRLQCSESIGALQDTTRNRVAWAQIVQVLAENLPAFPSVKWTCHFPVVPQWAPFPHPCERFADAINFP